MIIEKFILQTSNDIYKVIPDGGPAFYVRKEYFNAVVFEDIRAGNEYTGELAEEFLDAGLATAVEIKAMDYLARAEQCRFNLTQKLIKKEFGKKYINMSLDYLESIGYLSDQRFAAAWLSSRKINHYEGSSKLLAELQSRGISKEIARKAVEEFFENNDELEMGLKAYKRFLKQKKDDEKIINSMLNSGFSFKMIKEIKEILESK